MKSSSLIYATDMTLILGAESAVHSHLNVVDPFRIKCLVTLIDTVMNTPQGNKLVIPVPKEGHFDALPFYKALSEGLRQEIVFENLPAGDISLSMDMENQVHDSFLQFVKIQSVQTLRAWVLFQLFSPLVLSGHTTRMGQGSFVSDDGIASWKRGRASKVQSLFHSYPGVEKLFGEETIKDMRKNESLDETLKEFPLPLSEFPAVYAFDVFRRGWQYAERVRSASYSPVYFPHPLRYQSLDGSSSDWLDVAIPSDRYWSFGRYFVSLIDQSEYNYTPEEVGVMVSRLKKVSNTMGGINLGQINHSTMTELEVRRICKNALAISEEAGLPLLKMGEPNKSTRVTSNIVNAFGSLSLSASETTVQIMCGLSALPLGIIKPIVRCLNPDLVRRVDNQNLQAKRKMLNHSPFQVGQFGYHGLLNTDCIRVDVNN